MKILVTPINKKSGNKFSVVVMDGNLIIDKGLANSIAERDTIIWKLAEIYNVIDIEIVDLKNSKTVESKFSTIPSIPVIVEEETVTAPSVAAVVGVPPDNATVGAAL